MPPLEDTQAFVQILSVLMEETLEYEESRSKQLLWFNFLSTMTSVDDFRDLTSRMGYLHAQPRTIHCDHGLVVYTAREYQVHLHLVLPKRAMGVLSLLEEGLRAVRVLYPEGSVDASFLQGQVPEEVLPPTVPRRFLQSPRHVRILRLDGTEAVCYHNRRQPVERLLADPREICQYRPLATMRLCDPEDTLYWHRFPCGTLALLRNPVLEPFEPIPLPYWGETSDKVDGSVVCLSAVSTDFLRCIDPGRLEDSLVVVCNAHVPMPIRSLAVQFAVHKLGIYDRLILVVGDIFDEQVGNSLSFDHPAVAMVYMARIMRSKTSPRNVVDSLLFALPLFQDEFRWKRWMLRSRFLFQFLEELDPILVQRLWSRIETFRALVALLLHAIIGKWKRHHEEKARLLVQTAPEGEEDRGPPFGTVHQEFARLCLVAEGESEALTRAEARRAKTRSASRRKAAVAVVPARDDDQDTGERQDVQSTSSCAAPPTTHHSLVAKLERDVVGLPCRLVGSGLFFTRGNDADVVITDVEAQTLEEAYEFVRLRTGWTPRYKRVTGEHVVVLRGTLEGVLVDVQVWRGTPDTPSERETAKALSLSRRLETFSDAACRRRVETLHVACEAAGLKGHLLCRLSGVAVTCLAVLLREDEETTEGGKDEAATTLFTRLRRRLACETPRFDFEDDAAVAPSLPGRCLCPLAVMVQERNVLSRMTAGTTRHLLDTVAHALTLQTSLLDTPPHVYKAWRRSHMVPCLRTRPRDGEGTLSRTLHAALAALDGHPLVDTVHVEEEEEEEEAATAAADDGAASSRVGMICVRVALRADADPLRYGFREGDTVERTETERVVRVTRGGRSWPLLADTAVGKSVVAWGARRRVTDVLRVAGEETETERKTKGEEALCVVPNAPYLTVDVRACFDSKHWE